MTGGILARYIRFVAISSIVHGTTALSGPPPKSSSLSSETSWQELEHLLNVATSDAERPLSIDSVLNSNTPVFSMERPTLFRERHGWCPYSERVWLALEMMDGVKYDTVRIDNSDGPRPTYFSGQTPQLRWPDGKTQGESMDLVEELDRQYNGGRLYSAITAPGGDVHDCITQFRSIFPRARPSSRAAFLFQQNGEPLWRTTFEQTLQQTDALLGKTSAEGPFFCGSHLSAADIAWAPFLERYRYQLPCLHEGLEPYDEAVYPNLTAWYRAMENVPSYACKVAGDASSWRKVLSMAGFGNSGVPPSVQSNMAGRMQVEVELARRSIKFDVWDEYASTRPSVVGSPHADAAAAVVRNRHLLIKDTLKHSTGKTEYSKRWGEFLPKMEQDIEVSLRELAGVLVETGLTRQCVLPAGAYSKHVLCMAAFLDVRIHSDHIAVILLWLP
jgi:glutathione S-transferase